MRDGISGSKIRKITYPRFFRTFETHKTSSMKRLISFLFLVVLLAGCNSDDDNQILDDNPFLNEPPVSLTLNLNLPQYNPLKFPGNSILINSQGIRGIVIYNVNNDLYTAFDLSDPNHIPSGCSRMEIDGIIARCPCPDDENAYDIVTGQHDSNQNAYPMQQYRAQRSGDVLQISN